MVRHPALTRRGFVHGALALSAGAVAGGCAADAFRDARLASSGGPAPERDGGSHADEAGVSPAEDLMREHGVLKRVLLVYGEVRRRLDSGGELPPETLAAAAATIRDFIEGYHETLEEDFLFPRFREAHVLVELVDVLDAQHRAGRRVTATIESLATLRAFRDVPDRARLSGALAAFVRMYEPHEAREDTVLFPALRTILGAEALGALGEDFEDREHERFGDDGFQRVVESVAGIETQLGIHDLAQFTPRV